MQYGDTSVRRAVPLALGLCHVSDPNYGIVDVLSRLSHDANAETVSGIASAASSIVLAASLQPPRRSGASCRPHASVPPLPTLQSQCAIFALGLVSAGTNNSRVAAMLRTLATFYRSEAAHLFVVRIAQGMLHMGKGLLTISPFHSDRMLLSPVALAGVISATLGFLDVRTMVHGKFHFLLYSLAASMNPRWVSTVSEVGAELKVEVRVGTAVETVGQAGRPKTITGFQTHTTPVLMGVRDRAELADDKYLPLTNVVEGVVVLRPNPAASRGTKK